MQKGKRSDLFSGKECNSSTIGVDISMVPLNSIYPRYGYLQNVYLRHTLRPTIERVLFGKANDLLHKT
jgi:hypothetical protein